MTNDENLKTDIKDLLNQIMVKLQNVSMPEIDEEYCYWDHPDAGTLLPVSFLHSYEKGNPNFLPAVKAVVGAMLKDIDSDSRTSQAEKMARAYYSSFCNG